METTDKTRTIEEKLAALGRRVDDLIEDLRKVEKKDVQPRVREEADVWKQTLDELRVHAELGRMEFRDRIEPVLKKADQVTGEIERRFAEVRRTDQWDELERTVRTSLQSLSRELKDAQELGSY